jgi:hypothetical protein
MKSIYDDTLTPQEEHWHFWRQELDWANSTFNEYLYDKKEAKRFDTQNKKILADMYWQESQWCYNWYNKRIQLAEKQAQLSGLVKSLDYKKVIKKPNYISHKLPESAYKNKLTESEQHLHIAHIQRHWASDAMRDANYNKNQAKLFKSKGKLILAQMYQTEYEWCIFWYNRRIRIVEKHEKQVK